jgi:hypothetical protein
MKKLQIIFYTILIGVTSAAQNLSPRLIDLAKSTFEVVKLNPTDPSPPSEWMGDNALNLNARSIKCSLWGPPDIITFSLSKNDVWDRRSFNKPLLTLRQMIDSVQQGDWTRHYYDSYQAYDFPTPKPVGQIQIRCPELKNASSPEAKLAMSDGVVTITAADSTASIKVKFANLMTGNVMILKGEVTGIPKFKIRLFRHFDSSKSGQSWIAGSEGKAIPLEGYDYSIHKDEDGPLKPPESGIEGNIVWIRQEMPPEKTFPNGFSYLFAAVLKDGKASFETSKGFGLAANMEISEVRKEKAKTDFWFKTYFKSHGPKYEPINAAMGVAADINIESKNFCVVFTVVTSIDLRDGQSLLQVAKKRLSEEKGAKDLFIENKHFYDVLYSRREKGRIVATNDNNENIIREAFRSWTQEHSGSTACDPELLQCDNTYAYMEQDWSQWHSDIHFNEAEPTLYCVTNQLDRLLLWEKILNKWLPLAKKNAKDVYNLPGAFYGLSFVPILSDEIYHTHEVWEQSMELTAQNLRVPWLCYEYSGDPEYLKRIWEVMEESCRFYKAYLTRMEDGKLHVFPTVSAEQRGFTKKLNENMDSMSSLSLIAWCLKAGTECARLLGKETDETKSWALAAGEIAPYPEWNADGKTIYTDMRNCPPVEYNFVPQTYPVLMTDEINLDSPTELKEMMKNTIDFVKGWPGGYTDKAKYVLGYDKGITPEHLLNSRSGDAFLFPAVKEDVKIGFKDFLAKGGFEISALYENQRAENIIVRSLAGNRCCLVLPQRLKKVDIFDNTTHKNVSCSIIPAKNDKRERVEWLTQKGHEYRIFAD